jgi:hypothetical protein
MLNFLFFIFLIFAFIIILGLVFVGKIVHTFLHLGRKVGGGTSNKRQQQEENYQDNVNSKKQIFGDDEGEYVDFEEVKEDDKNKE